MLVLLPGLQSDSGWQHCANAGPSIITDPAVTIAQGLDCL